MPPRGKGGGAVQAVSRGGGWRPVPERILARLKDAVGRQGWMDDPAEMEPHLVDQRGLFRGRSPLLLRPATTEQVASVVRICAEARVPVVPQGGNTGLVGGSVPFEHGGEIVLSLSRLNRIRRVDAANRTITAEAGCVVARVQRAAEEANLLFPLSLASEGSCEIGGVVSTNAGGNAVLRYGTMRDLVLGLEVVLADGEVWDGLRSLRKDTSGYDVKQLFIGAEGTLGVVTAAVLRLFSRPREVATAFVAVADVAAAIDLFHELQDESDGAVTGYELLPRAGLGLVLAHVPGTRDPLPSRSEHYVLVELSSGRAGRGLRTLLENLLAGAAERGTVIDAAIAASAAQAGAFWRLRESLSEAQKKEGASIKHDISLPLPAVPHFLTEAGRRVKRLLPGVRVVAFGHLGDGTVHYNLSQPTNMAGDAFLARWPEASRVVHDLVASLGGSISAEHGIGRLKRDELLRYKSTAELRLMRRLKEAFDPHDLLNPGKTVPADGKE